jgi:hypothetical protein
MNATLIGDYLKRQLGPMVVALLASFFTAASSSAASFGVNFQTNRDGYGPASVAAETPASAFGVPAADWYEPGSVEVGSGPFATGVGSVNLNWSSYPLAEPGIAYGWTHANQPGVTSPPGNPASGEDAVLSAFLFGSGPGEYAAVPNGAPIVVTISNLGSIADLNAGYSVRLLASSEWTVNGFTPANVTDNAAHAEMVNFGSLFPDRPLWWTGPPYESCGAMGTSSAIFTGDTLTITLTGRNESGSPATNDYVRTALAGVIVDYTAVPEPGAFVLLTFGAIGAVALRFHPRKRVSPRLA